MAAGDDGCRVPDDCLCRRLLDTKFEQSIDEPGDHVVRVERSVGKLFAAEGKSAVSFFDSLSRADRTGGTFASTQTQSPMVRVSSAVVLC